MVFVRIQSSKLLTLENEKKTVFLLHFTHLFDFDSRAVEDTSVRENSKFFWFSSHLIDFDSRAVEGTHVREISKFFWISAHLIDFDSKAVEVTHARKNQIFICFFARLIVTLQAKDGENRHQLSEVEQDIECWE